ncbi:hypothetical protein ACU6QO_01760, partial [Aeromonas veronii]|uniref:hypothetical protein n=1 Tax=Aeromonas veronii TaxID=654 RepID=UPI00406D21D7
YPSGGHGRRGLQSTLSFLDGKSLEPHIWFEAEGYLVVLDDRGEYILPWTAFFIEHEHERRKYNKRWKRYGSY